MNKIRLKCCDSDENSSADQKRILIEPSENTRKGVEKRTRNHSNGTWNVTRQRTNSEFPIIKLLRKMVKSAARTKKDSLR